MMPYVFQAVFLLILFIECYRNIFIRFSNIIRRLLGMAVLIVGGGIAFAIHPIYEGDFKLEYKPVFFTGSSSHQLEDGLTMIVLPGCPYCYERLTDLNRLAELYPSQEIYISVVNNDSLALEEYQESANDLINVSLAKDQNALKSLIGERYPSFIYLKPGTKEGMLWNNNGFGVAAVDFILEQ
jgi:thiol-disulfide isomerase/thioredoxin